MRLLRSLLVVTVVALVPFAPTAAHADSKGHRDARGDVGSVAYDPSTHQVTESPSTPEPGTSLGDIAKVRVVHGPRTLDIKLRFRELAKAGSEQIHEFGIASPKGVRYVFVDARPGHWKGRAYMMKANLKKRVSCKIGGRIDYGRNTVTVKVPRSCLGKPKVVKVGAETFVINGSKLYYDQAYANGGQYTDLIAASPKVRR